MKFPTIIAFMQNPWFPEGTKKEHILLYKNDQELTTKQKINSAIHEVNRKMFQIERIIHQNLKLKTETKFGNDGFWKSSNEKIHKISERLIRIAESLTELNNIANYFSFRPNRK